MSLHHEVRTFLASKRMLPTTFGRLALNDPCFVFDLRKGREPRPATAERVRAFMAGQSA